MTDRSSDVICDEIQGGEGERLLARDPHTWEALHERVYPVMMNYALRRLSNVELAHDAVAEAMVRVVATRERLVHAVSPEAWCIGVLRHVVADVHRHAYRERDKNVEPPNTINLEVGERLELDAEHQAVRTAFERLDESDRDVLQLRVIAGLSSEEVAEVLETSPGAVRMAQSRALDRLRRLMGEEVGV
ncbi:MAG: RNA polymerase sigma factor [Acidimicrobiales bacterium]